MSSFLPECLVRSWGGEAAVFHIASGDTHYLQPFTFALYQIYQQCRNQNVVAGASEMAQRLAERMAIPVDAEFLDMTHEAIANLQHIGLLQRE